jgi:hypothetical protein
MSLTFHSHSKRRKKFECASLFPSKTPKSRRVQQLPREISKTSSPRASQACNHSLALQLVSRIVACFCTKRHKTFVMLAMRRCFCCSYIEQKRGQQQLLAFGSIALFNDSNSIKCSPTHHCIFHEKPFGSEIQCLQSLDQEGCWLSSWTSLTIVEKFLHKPSFCAKLRRKAETFYSKRKYQKP